VSSFLHLGFRLVRVVRFAEEERVRAEVTAEHAAPASHRAVFADRPVAERTAVQRVSESLVADLAAVDRGGHDTSIRSRARRGIAGKRPLC